MSTNEQLAQALRELANKFSEGWHDGLRIDASDIVLLSDAAGALAANEEGAATSSDVDDAEYRLTDAIWVYGEACIHGDASDIANKTERVECLIGELIAVAVANAAPANWRTFLEYNVIPRLEQARASAFERGDKLADAFLATKEEAAAMLKAASLGKAAPDALQAATAARIQAQMEVANLKERLARARINLMTELRERGWTPPGAAPAATVPIWQQMGAESPEQCEQEWSK